MRGGGRHLQGPRRRPSPSRCCPSRPRNPRRFAVAAAAARRGLVPRAERSQPTGGASGCPAMPWWRRAGRVKAAQRRCYSPPQLELAWRLSPQAQTPPPLRRSTRALGRRWLPGPSLARHSHPAPVHGCGCRCSGPPRGCAAAARAWTEYWRSTRRTRACRHPAGRQTMRAMRALEQCGGHRCRRRRRRRRRCCCCCCCRQPGAGAALLRRSPPCRPCGVPPPHFPAVYSRGEGRSWRGAPRGCRRIRAARRWCAAAARHWRRRRRCCRHCCE